MLGPLLLAGALATGAPGFAVIAPDRGFLGNEELRDSFDAFAKGRNAALVFATDERTRDSVARAAASLRAAGARRVVVLPFFLSRSDPRFRLAEAAFATAAPGMPVVWGRPYGESYFAVEALAERLRGLGERAARRLIVVGAGATDAASRQQMAADWQRLAERASAGLGFESATAVVESSVAELGKSLAAAAGGGRGVAVPFHLGSKLDGMMSYTAAVRRAAGALEVIDGDATPSPTIAPWLQREANRFDPPAANQIGVVALAHGGDFHWNETMRQAIAPLGQRYLVEPAFSMADPLVIGRAVRRLEARGARAIVVLRAFGLAASFRDDVERLIGLDVEGPDAEHAHHRGHGGGHDGHGGGDPPARLLSSAVLTTVGGMEDHPFFAQALLDRAKELSRDPGRETLILVAHGDGDDERDAHWQRLLESLAARMRAVGGAPFRAIHAATWREDWPAKREPAVKRVRALVEQASRQGGRAIVLPARILGRGPERRFLDGLSYELGEGFAPHPLFARWAEEQVAKAVEALASAASTREAAGSASAMQSLSATPR